MLIKILLTLLLSAAFAHAGEVIVRDDGSAPWSFKNSNGQGQFSIHRNKHDIQATGLADTLLLIGVNPFMPIGLIQQSSIQFQKPYSVTEQDIANIIQEYFIKEMTATDVIYFLDKK